VERKGHIYKEIKMIKNKLELLKKLSSLLKISFNQPGLVILLSSAQKEHRLVEDKFAEMFSECECAKNSVFPFKELNAVKYFEKNFFSILFLSIFKAVGIPEERILRYGVILHALRTIITCTDNILDDENKGPVFLNADLDNPVLNNTMLSLLAHKVMGQAIREVSHTPETAARIEAKILDSICSIGKGENVTKIDDVMPVPDKITENVHMKIGGELLRLALIAPLENERELISELQYMESGVLGIGVALQMLDDVTDAAEDLLDIKSNYLASWIMYQSEDGIFSLDDLKEYADTRGQNFCTDFKCSVASVVNSAIEKALDGFDMLCCGGFPITRIQAVGILKLMFGLRGLTQEWKVSRYA
jgi:hypothetical protein